MTELKQMLSKLYGIAGKGSREGDRYREVLQKCSETVAWSHHIKTEKDLRPQILDCSYFSKCQKDTFVNVRNVFSWI